jgi:predicted anti-sigma-YlaC factor YlaD
VRVRFAVEHRWTRRRLSQRLDDELGTSAHRRMRRHESECPECRELLASLRQLLILLAAVNAREEEPTPALGEAVRARLHEPG